MTETDFSDWEYHVEFLREASMADQAMTINRLGEEGWEFVSATRQGLIFRRPRTSQVEDPLDLSIPDNTVLVVEGESSLRFLLGTTLVLEGYRVLEAASGEQALQLLQRYTPRVVIIGERLSGLPELALVQAIRHLPRLRETRVILLVSAANAPREPAARAAGADLLLTKPISLGSLLAQVDAWTGPAL